MRRRSGGRGRRRGSYRVRRTRVTRSRRSGIRVGYRM